jgi:glycosyltransferase involved in cell wall biosynthesis
MIQGRDFVVLADDWHGLPTSANHLFRRLAQHNRVFWFNTIGRLPRLNWTDGGKVLRTVGRWMFKGFSKTPPSPLGGEGSGVRGLSPQGLTPHPNPSPPRREGLLGQTLPPGLHLSTPVMVPWFKHIVRQFNRWSLLGQYRRLQEEYGISRPIVVTTFPYAVDVVKAIPDALKIYYCVDDFLDYPGVAHADWEAMERELLTEIDAMVVTSRKLADKRLTDCPLLHLPHGVDCEHFQQAWKSPRSIAALEKIPRPIVGFFGLISSWVDVNLVGWLSECFPHVSFVLIGRGEVSLEPLAGRPNVHCLGLVPYADLPWYARYFDVGLIPFVLNRLTKAVNPLKLLEYYALGLPVLSTRLPELEYIPGPLRLAVTRDQFASGLRDLLGAGQSRDEALRVARGNTWDQRVESLGDFVESVSDCRSLAVSSSAA